MANKSIAAALFVLGVGAVFVTSMVWAPCWSAPLGKACLTAADTNVGSVAMGFWLPAALLAGVGIFFGRGRTGALLAVVLLIVINPLLDPGFFWAFGSADMTPGTGILSSATIVAAGFIIWGSASHAHHRNMALDGMEIEGCVSWAL